MAFGYATGQLLAPFPYFGGKSAVAGVVWERLGDVENYIEPFAGSLAVLLGRPHAPRVETVNDADGLLANFWRALKLSPDEVAEHADWPVNENDLHARHAWLVGQRESITARLEGDPDWHDPKAAGWWVWGISCWIGSGWCSGNGPWIPINGELVDTSKTLPDGIWRKLPHLGDAGKGVHRKRPHLGDPGRGVNRKLPYLGDAGKGVYRQRPDLGTTGKGVHRRREDLLAYMRALAERLRDVRVCCGDWSRVCGPAVCWGLINRGPGTTGVFLDPPYDGSLRDTRLYATDDHSISAEVRAWAIEAGRHPSMRICLAGYHHEHAMPPGWTAHRWAGVAGYAVQNRDGDNTNRTAECLWFSPHCLAARDPDLPIFG